MSEIKFVKMTAGGNDFIIIDNRKHLIPSPEEDFAREVCPRRISVGADGLILIENSKAADFKMRYFNPDGKEVEMCGNGARCLAKFAHLKGITSRKSRKIIFETRAGIHKAEVIGNRVRLKMVDPSNIRLNFPLKIGNKEYKAYFVNTGVPHLVIFVRNLDSLDVQDLGSKIRHHQEFQPQGTNANFLKIEGENRIRVRTYERGVEGETLACGTGAVACALIGNLAKGIESPVEVWTKGGDVLKVYFKYSQMQNKLSEVYLEGNVKVVYEGTYES